MISEKDLISLPDSVKVQKASTALQLKAGTGEISKDLLLKAETVVETANVDFVPMAEKYLEELTIALKNARKEGTDAKTIRNIVTKPVMQLKADAGMFGYKLVGDLANVLLGFIESLQNLDNDAIAIIEANQQSLFAVVKNRMKGSGGETGKILYEELVAACARYQQKRKI